MPKEIWDLTGKKFGRLTVLSFAEFRYQPCGRKNAYWNCICDCGKKTVAKSGNLLRGSTKSCGCYARELRYKGGQSKLYSVHRMMVKRCRDPGYKFYPNYGGRGIDVCEEWTGHQGYQTFRAWAESNGYRDGLSIERIDNDKGYSPDNCRWATWKEQCNNKRNNVNITIDGETKTLTQWCEHYGVDYDLVYNRYRILGWDIMDAITQPLIDPRKEGTLNERKQRSGIS